MILELSQAQALFDALPPCRQWPTLSPAYVAADARRDPELTPVFLASRQQGGWLLHAVHEAPVPGAPQLRDWQSAYGYGGPLAHDLDDRALARAWAELEADAHARQVVAEFVRFHPGAENHLLYNGTVREDRPVVSVPLQGADLLASYAGRARNAVRKAEREGLSTVWVSAQEARARFPDFYRNCMREIGASDFYIFGDSYFDAVLQLPGARVLVVQRDDHALSMGLFLFGSAQAEYHLSGTVEAGRLAGATNLLLHAAACTARETGCQSLYLGGGVSAAPDDPLLRFKSSFAPALRCFRIGHRIHDEPRYQGLRQLHHELATSSRRVLFYRR
jgi:hypothetical protein